MKNWTEIAIEVTDGHEAERDDLRNVAEDVLSTVPDETPYEKAEEMIWDKYRAECGYEPNAAMSLNFSHGYPEHLLPEEWRNQA